MIANTDNIAGTILEAHGQCFSIVPDMKRAIWKLEY